MHIPNKKKILFMFVRTTLKTLNIMKVYIYIHIRKKYKYIKILYCLYVKILPALLSPLRASIAACITGM